MCMLVWLCASIAGPFIAPSIKMDMHSPVTVYRVATDPHLHYFTRRAPNLKKKNPRNWVWTSLGRQLIDIPTAGCQPLAMSSYFIAAHGCMFYSLTKIHD